MVSTTERDLLPESDGLLDILSQLTGSRVKGFWYVVKPHKTQREGSRGHFWFVQIGD